MKRTQEKKFKDKSKKLYDALAGLMNKYTLSDLKKIMVQEKKTIKGENYFRTLSNEIKIKGNVLEIGCGYGMCMHILGVKKYTGMDISNGFLKLARKLFPSAKFIRGDARRLDFKNGTFDFVFMFETIEHVPNYELALKEVHRVLKKDGTFVITTPNKLKWIIFPIYYLLPAKCRPWGLYLIGSMDKEMRDCYLKSLDVEEKIGQKEHIKMFSPKELKNELENNGFVIKKIYRYRTCLDGRVSEKLIKSKFYQKILKKILPCESIMIICSK
jgi:ubiquinone/menaquinone biosynthesis C-methylase UbiE